MTSELEQALKDVETARAMLLDLENNLLNNISEAQKQNLSEQDKQTLKTLREKIRHLKELTTL